MHRLLASAVLSIVLLLLSLSVLASAAPSSCDMDLVGNVCAPLMLHIEAVLLISRLSLTLGLSFPFS